mgnify:CR=1 FL=1
MPGLPVLRNYYDAPRILDFDIENRPLSYWQPDRPTAEITAIAAAWVDHPREVMVWLLGRDDPVVMLQSFLSLYNEADMVTGHYIRKHDLPIINGALMDYNMCLLGPKLVQDTKVDMVKKADIPATQEHLSEMLGLGSLKVHMTQQMWREANRLTSRGLDLTEDRVVGDVVQHMELRLAMLDAGMLHPPRMWTP